MSKATLRVSPKRAEPGTLDPRYNIGKRLTFEVILEEKGELRLIMVTTSGDMCLKKWLQERFGLTMDDVLYERI